MSYVYFTLKKYGKKWKKQNYAETIIKEEKTLLNKITKSKIMPNTAILKIVIIVDTTLILI